MSIDRNCSSRSGCALASIASALVILAVSSIAEADGAFYQACGELVNTGGVPPCLVHIADDGQVVVPANLGEFEAGDRVVVSGTIDPNFASICDSRITPNLTGNTIDRCFAECGTLVDVGGCIRFDSDRGGSFVVPGAEDFSDGERVYIHAPGIVGAATCGGDELPNIATPLIAPCTSVTGRIIGPFGCTHLLTGDGNAYDFLTLAGFEPGDYVTIEGDASLGLSGACGNPFIDFNTIEPALGGPGTLIDSIDCGLLFRPDEGGFGIGYRLENVGEFTAGDRVVVTGRIDDTCASGGACVATCLVDNTIGALTSVCGSIGIASTECLVFNPDDGGAPFLIEHTQPVPAGAPIFVAGTFRPNPGICDNDENLPVMRDNLFLQCIDVCGEFRPGFECTPLFDADDGNIYWVENLGPYSAGDRARVHGGRDAGCNSYCPFPCIRANTIGPCDVIPADVNGDGSVDADDIPQFVAVLLGADTDAYRVEVSDVNMDGVPDGDDVQSFTLIVLGFQ